MEVGLNEERDFTVGGRVYVVTRNRLVGDSNAS